jgi:hypothetical protein
MGAEFMETFSRFQAARRGGLANYDLQRAQANLMPLKQAELTAGLQQAPEVRASPQALSLLGLQGPPTQGAAGALTGGPSAMDRFLTNVQQGRPVSGQPSDLPRTVETDSSVTRLLKGAQARQLNSLAGIYESLGIGTPGGQGGGAGGGGFQVEKIGPSGPTIARPKSKTYDAGTLGPDGKPLQPGYDKTTGEEVRVKRPAGVGKIGESIQRAKSGRITLERLLTPRGPGNKRPVDVVPDFSGPGMLNTLNRSVVGSIGVPMTDKNVGTAYLQNIARDKQNPDSESAQEILAAAGAITNLVKGFGDAANVAVPEEARLQEAFIPGYGDSPGVGGSAETKVKIAMQMLDDIVAAAEKNPNLTAGEVAAIMGKGFAAAGLDAPAPKEGYDPSAVVGGEIAAAAGSNGAAAATGTTPYNPDQRAADKQLFGLQ